MPTKKTKEDFINEAISIYGDKYGYNLVNYVNNHTPVDIWCNKCVKSFSRNPISFLGKRLGCPHCTTHTCRPKVTKEIFLERANKIHNSNFTYLELDFINVKDKIKWECKTCGNISYQVIQNHLAGHGCRQCYFNSLHKPHLSLKETNTEDLKVIKVENQSAKTKNISFHIDSISYHLEQIKKLVTNT